MKVGDLIKHKSKTQSYDWYVGQKFLIVETKDATVVSKGRNGSVLRLSPKRIKVVRMPNGHCLWFNNVESWEVISASR